MALFEDTISHVACLERGAIPFWKLGTEKEEKNFETPLKCGCGAVCYESNALSWREQEQSKFMSTVSRNIDLCTRVLYCDDSSLIPVSPETRSLRAVRLRLQQYSTLHHRLKREDVVTVAVPPGISLAVLASGDVLLLCFFRRYLLILIIYYLMKYKFAIWFTILTDTEGMTIVRFRQQN